MKENVTVVTNAKQPRSEIVRARTASYLALQAVRVALFLAAILLPAPMWLRIALVSVAGMLSIFAVTAANAPDASQPAPQPGSPVRLALDGVGQQSTDSSRTSS